MNWNRILITLSLLSLLNLHANGQGCSDAGFCTMGAMKPDQAYNKKVKLKLRSIELSYYSGQADLVSPVITVINLDAGFSITKNLSGQIKLPYFSVDGSFDKSSGLGDIALSLTQRVIDTKNFDLSATVGAKIPTNDSSIKSSGKKVPGSEGLVLPMYYQTSLGSVDIVAGASLISSKWLIATGIQMALTANNNTWWIKEWVDVYPSEPYVRLYADANLLKRGTDTMLRIERNFRFTKYSFNLGVLSIYRITKDQTVDRTTGEYRKVDKTTGLALTVLGGAAYNFNINNAVKFTYGLKLKDRDVNPDGLTRHSVMILAYLFRF